MNFILKLVEMYLLNGFSVLIKLFSFVQHFMKIKYAYLDLFQIFEMPRSKRNTKVALTKVRKVGKESKEKLIDSVKLAVEKFDNIFVWKEENMKNNAMKELKANEWAHSKFFFGKVKVMAFALGRTPAQELRPNLSKISDHLSGNVGLLFTNKEKTEVVEFFDSFSAFHYAKTGNTAVETVELEAGPLEQFPHSIEPHLRELGLPVKLNKSIVELTRSYTVCTEGEILKADQCKILKLLGNQMSQFKISLVCCWSKDGSFEVLQ